MNKIKAIITGSTGMVGEGVLHISLNHPGVESVLVINRKPCRVQHPKLKEIILKDFMDLSSIENQLVGYNACFFNMGVSSIGMNEADYKRITYKLTLNFGKLLHRINPDLTFCYVSGAGTDSTELGKSMWARVKGRTENDLIELFDKAYMFRPGFIKPIKGLKHSYTISKIMSPLYPLLKLLMGKYVCTLEELSLSMINSVLNGYDKKILENNDIRKSAYKFI